MKINPVKLQLHAGVIVSHSKSTFWAYSWCITSHHL